MTDPRLVRSSGHLVPFPATCMQCGQPAYESTTCPQSIECQWCGAGPGEVCRAPNGHARTRMHNVRYGDAETIDRLRA